MMKRIFLTVTIPFMLWSCGTDRPGPQDKVAQSSPSDTVIRADRKATGTIYEANIRQMTQEGTLKAFQEKHLDRIAEMGVGILWLMPIYPIGEKNRKGALGSYYSVKDYQAVNPDYGTMDDLRSLVKAAHAKGMKVILDWVANHTACDNAWATEHPDWYTHDGKGNFVPPVADWNDVIDLNYDNSEMRKAMIGSMAFWLKEADVDGFRCDVAEMVPIDFWIEARKQLDAVKPIFFLAEGERPELHKVFDMTYSWSFHHLMNEMEKGKAGASAMSEYFAAQDTLYRPQDLRMQFITNHDENSWNGTAIERMGDDRKAFAVMSFTVPGMPLIYSGMEADIDKRLKFFEKDAINWNGYPLESFYADLIRIKRENPALWNGKDGGDLRFFDADNDRVVFYVRSKGKDQLMMMMNLSDREASFTIESRVFKGHYGSCLNGDALDADGSVSWKLAPHGYQVFSLDGKQG